MAAQWYYVANQQQAGPVELQALQGMLTAGSLTPADLVFGPGLAAWTPAGQVPALSVGTPSADPSPAADPSAINVPLAYRGVETSTTGLSDVSMNMLRQTKPWVRFISVMIFIGVGFMVLGGIGMLVGAMMSSSRGPGAPAYLGGLGGLYLALAALYVMPAIFLNRYASHIASLMISQRTSDVEQALGAQKSFWKFAGIMTIVIIAVYIVFFIVLIATRGRL